MKDQKIFWERNVPTKNHIVEFSTTMILILMKCVAVAEAVDKVLYSITDQI